MRGHDKAFNEYNICKEYNNCVILPDIMYSFSSNIHS